MRLSENLITRFQKKHLEKFGKNLSLGEAEAELMELAEIIRITSHLFKDKKEENYGDKADKRSRQDTAIKLKRDIERQSSYMA